MKIKKEIIICLLLFSSFVYSKNNKDYNNYLDSIQIKCINQKHIFSSFDSVFFKIINNTPKKQLIGLGVLWFINNKWEIYSYRINNEAIKMGKTENI